MKPLARQRIGVWAALVLIIVTPGCNGNAEAATDDGADLADYEGQEFANETYPEYDARRDSYEGDRGSFPTMAALRIAAVMRPDMNGLPNTG